MKIRIWYYVIDGEDGSAHPTFFTTQEEMEKELKERVDNDERDMSEGGSYEDIEVQGYEVVE